LHEARKVLAQLQHAAEVVRGVAQGLQGRLDIGITGSMVYRQVPGFCRAFRAERPLVELCLHEMSTRDQLQAIARGQIDCGFLNIGTPQDDIRTLSIGEEAFVCCLPSDHALARRRNRPARTGPGHFCHVCARGGSGQLRQRHRLSAAGRHPSPYTACRAPVADRHGLVSAGQGVALVPACMQTVGMNGVLRRCAAAG
jgi:DNA-binding transcriptional LysR family regulator